MNFFGFTLFGICLAFWIYRLCLSSNVGVFQALFLWIPFQLLPLSLLLLELQWHKRWTFCFGPIHPLDDILNVSLFPNNTIYFQSAFCIDFTLAVSGRNQMGCASFTLPHKRKLLILIWIFTQLEGLERKKQFYFSNSASSCLSIFCLCSDCKVASVWHLFFTILPYTTRCNQSTL